MEKMPNKLKVVSTVQKEKQRTQVICGRRVVNYFMNTTIQDRDLTVHVKCKHNPEVQDLKEDALVKVLANIYGFESFPCEVELLDKMPVIPTGSTTGYCHCIGKPAGTVAAPSGEKIEVVSRVETGIEIKSHKGDTAEKNGVTVEVVNDVIVTLVQPKNESRTFESREEMLQEAGLREVAVVNKSVEVKN